jgi:hypothetical protein
MASLLERMNIDKEQSGPTRSAKSKGTRGGSSSPYVRRPRRACPASAVLTVLPALSRTPPIAFYA